MPDSIVPIVRRPVRRLSTVSSSGDSKVSELSTATRKLSIGEETNERASPPRLTRSSWLSSKTPGEERRRSLISGEKSKTASPEPEPAKSQDNHNCFPAASKDNLPALPVARNRPIKTSKDLELERKVLQWMVNILKVKPESPSMYERWIQDGTILAKLMMAICFNSVPREVIHANWGCNPVLDRVNSVIFEMRRYGVTDMFEPQDLMELRNIPRVTRTLAQLCKLLAADTDNPLNN